jgi:non-specific serine/threonine protein kinase
VEESLRIAGALWRFWFTRSHLTEGNRVLCELLEVDSSVDVQPEIRGRALYAAGNLAQACGDLERAVTLHRESLVLRQTLGDRRGIAFSLNAVANVAVERGDYAEAQALYEESLALRRSMGDQRGIAVALNNLSVIARDQGDWSKAAVLSEGSAALFKSLGDKQGVALSLVTLGMAKYHQGWFSEAAELHRESLALFGELENKRDIAECFEVLALMACTHRQPALAARFFGAASRALEELGSSMSPARSARYRGYVAEVRVTLGEEAFAAAWAEGCAMPFEDAVAAALGAEQERPSPEPVRRPEPVRSMRSSGRSVAHTNGLTRREQEVTALLARGMTNREIAAELTITERTAETHVCKILRKLELSHRAQLTAWAVKHDLATI